MTWRFIYPSLGIVLFALASSIESASENVMRQDERTVGADCQVEKYTIERGWRPWNED